VVKIFELRDVLESLFNFFNVAGCFIGLPLFGILATMITSSTLDHLEQAGLARDLANNAIEQLNCLPNAKDVQVISELWQAWFFRSDRASTNCAFRGTGTTTLTIICHLLQRMLRLPIAFLSIIYMGAHRKKQCCPEPADKGSNNSAALPA